MADRRQEFLELIDKFVHVFNRIDLGDDVASFAEDMLVETENGKFLTSWRLSLDAGDKLSTIRDV